MERDDNPFIVPVDFGGMYSREIDIRHYIPEGFAIVDQARFERLLAIANAANVRAETPVGINPRTGVADSLIAYHELVSAIDALRPGDLDPLP